MQSLILCLLQHQLIKLEPADIQSAIFDRTQTLLKTSTDPELYYCSIINKLPAYRVSTLRALEEKYTTENDEMRKSVIFNTLRLLKFPYAHEIYNMYWKQFTNRISNKDQYINFSYEQPQRLAWACHRYCLFSESLGCSYRYLPFEASASKLAVQELKTGLGGVMPNVALKLIAFLIAYGHYHGTAPPNKILPEFLLSKLEELSDRMTVPDCRQIAFGLLLFLNQKTQLLISSLF